MKVDKSVKSTATTPVQGGGHSSSAQAAPSRSPTGEANAGGSANTATSSTQVHIGAANQLQGAIAAAPALDMNKVAAVRQAISEGRFQVNAHAVASGLIHSVRQLVQTQK